MVVATEQYYYYPNGDDFSIRILGVFDNKSVAKDIVRRGYDNNPTLTLTEDSQHIGKNQYEIILKD